MRWVLLAGGAALATACSSADEPPPTDAAAVAVEVGVPGGADGLDFAPFPPNGELRLQSFGQGGTHVLLAVRSTGMGNRAFVNIALVNSLTAVEVSSPPPSRPQLFACNESTCDLVPILAMAGGLTAPGVERDGLPIRVEVEVHTIAGLAASIRHDAVLSTADL